MLVTFRFWKLISLESGMEMIDISKRRKDCLHDTDSLSYRYGESWNDQRKCARSSSAL